MKQIRAEILSNKRVIPKHYKMILYAPGVAEESEPGQFIHIRISNKYSPLIRRPLSIHRVVKDSSIEILYKVVGNGTAILSNKNKGEHLDIIGPLGNGYPVSDKKKNIILTGGGTGVASLFFLAEMLIKRSLCKPTVLIGAKEKSTILCEDDFLKLGCKVKIATEDGSKGFKGLVTDLLKSAAGSSRKEPGFPGLYACGPRPMLKQVTRISRAHKIHCQVCLEEYMACGVGACMGCVIKTRIGNNKGDFVYKLVCKDGPVFDSSEIIWD